MDTGALGHRLLSLPIVWRFGPAAAEHNRWRSVTAARGRRREHPQRVAHRSRRRQRDAMAEPTPLPLTKASGEDERSVLLGYLAYHRAVLARKAEGLSDEQARRAACPPSALTLLGLIRHMTDVERWWFRRVWLAEDIPALFDDEEEWRLPSEATIAGALAAYWDARAVVVRDLAT